MKEIKAVVGVIGIAVALSACGGTTAAGTSAKATTTSGSTSATSIAQQASPQYCLGKKNPPKGDTVDDPSGGPTASSCWADGMFVGNGSLKSKEIIFASKEADLLQYEATSAMFVDQAAWSKWKTQASKYIDKSGITAEAANLAELLDSHQVFSLPPGNPVVSAGFQKTYPGECQSSAVVDKNKPSPQYLVEETGVSQKSVTNGKTSTKSISWTDVMAKVGADYELVHIFPTTNQNELPSCAG